MYKFLRVILCLFLLPATLFAQSNRNSALVVGRVVARDTKENIADAQISITTLKVTTTTGNEGEFVLSEVPFGTYRIVVSGTNIKTDSFAIIVNKNVDMGAVLVTLQAPPPPSITSDIPTIGIQEDNVSTTDDNIQVQTADGLAVSRNDPFYATATPILNINNHWTARGYKNSEQELRVNGIVMNDVSNFGSAWNQWAGLGTVFHISDVTVGLSPSDYTFGDLNGSAYIKNTAADQRKETMVSYTATDRTYRNQVSLTHNSGLMKNGWAYSIAVSKRWAEEGYVPGTFYNGYSYYASVSKVIKKNTFSITTFGAPTERGKSGFTTEEARQLDGNNYYNPNWGYQDGAKRNARVEKEFQPVMMLTHVYRPSENTVWTTSLSYQFGKDKNSTLDWYNSTDPRPDYYKYLPSWQLNQVPPNPQAYAQLRDSILANKDRLQINWNKIYQNNYLNYDSITNVNGISGNTVRGHQSTVVLANDVQDVKKWSLATNLQRSLNEHVTVYTGIDVLAQQTHSYRELADLLGGDYFVNYNQFAAQQYVGNPAYVQNNLKNPNQVIKVGDIYGYNYINNYLNGVYRAQVKFNYNKYDFFAGGFIGLNTFNRDGLMQNGLFPNNSYGTSATQNFLIYGLKGGIDYKINGYNIFYVNAEIKAEPPTVDNTYISSRTRDYTVNNPTVQIDQSIEAGYRLNMPNTSVRVTGYATSINNATVVKRFYNDDPAYQTFVNYVMQNVNMQFTGTELAIEHKILKELSVTGIASIGQAFYANRPNITVYLDNDTVKNPHSSQAYIKNYYLATGPQTAYSLGFNYHKSRKWGARANFTYCDRNYVDINPDRRTTAAAGGLTPGSSEWSQVFAQEELPSYFVVDVSGNYSINLSSKGSALPRNTVLDIRAGINNLLNNTNIISRGAEQLRYDFTNSNPATFPNKYLYASGINFIISASLKF